MNRVLLALLAVGLGLAAGCGDNMLRARGRLLKGGHPLLPKEGETVQVLLMPIPADGKPPTDQYYAQVDQTAGTFRVAGKDGRGMPPGKYRVAIEVKKNKKDLLGGKFDAEKSPFVIDVPDESVEIVIDLDKPPAK